MAGLKTTPNKRNVMDYLDAISDERRRRDALGVLALMKAITKAKPEMWGSSIVGFGRHRYKYDSGHEGEWFRAGFSSRKQNLTLYLMGGLEGFDELLAKLGKYKTGKCCLYVKTLDDVHLPTLKELVRRSVKRSGSLPEA